MSLDERGANFLRTLTRRERPLSVLTLLSFHRELQKAGFLAINFARFGLIELAPTQTGRDALAAFPGDVTHRWASHRQVR